SGNGSGNGTSTGSANGHALIARPFPLVFIPAGSQTTRSAELLGSPQFRDFLAEVSQSYEVVVLDSSPLLPVSDTLEMLPHVDSVILCARAAKTTREEASAVRAVLAHLPDRPTGLVVTGIKPGDHDYSYAYGYS